VDNRVKRACAEGRPAHGMFVMIPAPAIVEVAGYAGFDFVILDTEHGAAGPETVEHLLRAADAAGITPIVRITAFDRGLVLRALDAGALGVLVPHVRSVAEAEAVVAACKYPPVGARGLATTSRAGRHGVRTVAEHLEWSNREILVAVQIEDAEALPAIEAIAAVPGLDVLFIGPADLSLSMGHAGRPDHPAVQEAIGRIFAAAKAAGKEIGYFVRDAEGAKAIAARGARMVSFSSTTVLTATFQQLVAALQQGS